MCRFLLVKSSFPQKPQKILTLFAQMAQSSRAPDGDIQGDGWGIVFLKDNLWQRHVSLNPIWESTSTFSQFPSTNIFLAHARSSSFPQDKGRLNYNQPYINQNSAFVFNGLLENVSLPFSLSGQIGAQKIWSLIQKFGFTKSIILLNQYAKNIPALNLSLCDQKSFSVYSQFQSHPNYYSLHLHQSKNITLVCSEPLSAFQFKILKPKQIHVF